MPAPEFGNTTLISILGSVITLLMGILIFMGQSLLKRVDIIKEAQEQNSVETAEIKKDISTLSSDIQSLKTALNELPTMKERILENTMNIKTMQDILREYRELTMDHAKLIRQLERGQYGPHK